jgi:hypothetical protein
MHHLLLHLLPLVQVKSPPHLQQQQQHWTICAALSVAPHLSMPPGQTQEQETQPDLLLLLLLGVLLRLQTHSQQQETLPYQTGCCCHPLHRQQQQQRLHAAPDALRLREQQYYQTPAQVVIQTIPSLPLLLLTERQQTPDLIC